MDEEQAEINMSHHVQKRRKHKFRKANKNEESSMGKEEAHNVGKIKAVEDIQISENEEIAEAKRQRNRDKEKKKSKGTKDIEPSIEPGGYAKDGNGDAMNNVEREMKKKKRKKTEKNKDKDDIFVGGDVKQVESEKWSEGEPVSMMKGCKEPRNKTKNRKAIINHPDGENDKDGAKDGKDVKMHIENYKVNDVEIVKRRKRKRDKNDDNGESMVDLITSSNSIANRILDNENSRNDLSNTGSAHKEDFGKKTKKKMKRKKESDGGVISSLNQENLPENSEGNIQSTKHSGKELERKKGHKKKTNCKDDSSGAQQESVDDGSNVLVHATEMQSNGLASANKVKGRKIKAVENGSNEVRDKDAEHAKKGKKKKKKKKKKAKSVENGSNEIQNDGLSANKEPKPNRTLEVNDSDALRSAKKGTKKRNKLVEDGSHGQTTNKSNKKVRFSGQDEVFPVPFDLNSEKENDDEDNLVRGKRFTREEDEIVKNAVEKYIEEHDLGEDGLHMVLNSSKYPKLRGCWREIGSAIPYRPRTAVYYRAQVLFRRSENRKWTQEEYDEILQYQKEHGNDWKALADELGKHRWHVKDTWRRIKLANRNTGNWSQDEYQKLFNLVNTDLQLKVSEEKKSKHGMLRDNIPWTAISDTLSTRTHVNCCIKWYKQLTSPMVSEGIWADVDDYRLLDALYSLDATCMEDVDWDNVLDNRSGDVCRKRWNQMVLHIGQHGNKSFAEQVEVLAQRYCPHLIEPRETWDSKPRVP